jgi:ubiquinone/menaquinone biosynthesis C-methylase UbiE
MTRLNYPPTASDRLLLEMGYDILSELRRAVQMAELNPSSPVLDVATGSGRMTLALREAGYHVISGDISEEVVSETRQRIGDLVQGFAQFRILDATHLDLPDSSVQSVVTANAMHHMNDPDRVLEEMTRVLRPDGKLVFVEFNERGFKAIDRAHQSIHGKRHCRGRISANRIHAFLVSRFEQVRRHRLTINNVWIAGGKRNASDPRDHGAREASSV